MYVCIYHLLVLKVPFTYILTYYPKSLKKQVKCIIIIIIVIIIYYYESI